MHYIFIYSGFLISFVCMVLPYQYAAKQKCNSLSEVLLNDRGVMNLNKRNLKSMTAMLGGIVLYWLSNTNTVKQTEFGFSPLFVVALLLGVIVFIISPYTTGKLRSGDQETKVNSSFAEYLLIRIPFLIIYEIYFRGVLLIICINQFGISAAIVSNVILYAVAHVYSSRKEMIGTVPFGLVLCLATTITQSVWPAIIMHLLLALPYEIFLLSKKQLTTKTF